MAGAAAATEGLSLRHDYGPEEVRAQIDAAAEAGVSEWIMWDAQVRYTQAAYPPTEQNTATSPPGDSAEANPPDTAAGP